MTYIVMANIVMAAWTIAPSCLCGHGLYSYGRYSCGCLDDHALDAPTHGVRRVFSDLEQPVIPELPIRMCVRVCMGLQASARGVALSLGAVSLCDGWHRIAVRWLAPYRRAMAGTVSLCDALRRVVPPCVELCAQCDRVCAGGHGTCVAYACACACACACVRAFRVESWRWVLGCAVLRFAALRKSLRTTLLLPCLRHRRLECIDPLA